MANHKCNHPGCTNDATHEIVWKLRQKPDGVAATSTPIARLCDTHKDVNLWDAFYTPAGWKLITSAFTEMGLKRPVREHSTLKAQPIGTAKHTFPNIKPGTGFQMN